MKKQNNTPIEDIFIKNLKTIDLHGFTYDQARIATNDFINECLILKQEKCVIIHGIGEGIVKTSVHDTLKQSHYVVEYGIDCFNPGITVIKLKFDK